MTASHDEQTSTRGGEPIMHSHEGDEDQANEPQATAPHVHEPPITRKQLRAAHQRKVTHRGRVTIRA